MAEKTDFFILFFYFSDVFVIISAILLFYFIHWILKIDFNPPNYWRKSFQVIVKGLSLLPGTVSHQSEASFSNK